MGVDAVIYAGSSRMLSDDEVFALSKRLAAAVGPKNFFFDEEGGSGYRGGHALSVLGEDKGYETPGADDIRQWLYVHCWSRYYGPGYERGSLHIIAAICEFLEQNGLRVWYGGDSGDELERWAFIRADLWKHWAGEDGQEYHRTIGSWCAAEEREPWAYRACVFCDEPMTRNGAGPRSLRSSACHVV